MVFHSFETRIKNEKRKEKKNDKNPNPNPCAPDISSAIVKTAFGHDQSRIKEVKEKKKRK